MSTTLRPTPPVAPATRTTPEVSILLTGSLDVGLDSFSIRDAINLTNENIPLGTEKEQFDSFGEASN